MMKTCLFSTSIEAWPLKCFKIAHIFIANCFPRVETHDLANQVSFGFKYCAKCETSPTIKTPIKWPNIYDMRSCPSCIKLQGGFQIWRFSTCVQYEPQLHIWYSSFPCLMGYFVICSSQWFGFNRTRGEAAKPEPAHHSLWLDHDQIAASSVIHGLWPLARPLDEVPLGLKPNIGMSVSRWNNVSACVGHKSELTGNQNSWNKKEIHYDESHGK